MIDSTDLQNVSALMAMLYSPRSTADFPGHVLSLLIKLIDLDRSNHGEIDSQHSQLPCHLTISSLPNIWLDLPPRDRQVLSQSLLPVRSATDLEIEKFTKSEQALPLQSRVSLTHYIQTHPDCLTTTRRVVSETDSHHLEGVYWRFHHPLRLDAPIISAATPAKNQIVADRAHLVSNHIIYLCPTDLIWLTVSRKGQTWSDADDQWTCQRDRYLLDFIYPHLIQARQNSISFTNIQPSSFSVELLQLLGLTKREAEVLWAISQDRSNADIAKFLKCSVSTVKKHLEHIYEKLNVQTRTAAVMTALVKLGLIAN
jgi:DNA-binding CsgD family transcriptional regulator